MRRLISLKRSKSIIVGLLLAAGTSVGVGKVIADYPLSDASGHIKDAAGTAKPIDASNDLSDAKAYAQAGPAAGTYGAITLSDDTAAKIKSAYFDGKTKLNLGPAKDSPLNITSDFTVTAWVKFEKTDGYHMILATGAGSGNGWKLGVFDDNLTFTACGVADLSVEDKPVDADKWMFLAVTVAKDGDARKINFFVNGKKVTDEALSADEIRPSETPQMHIGGADNDDDTNENFVGNLADLKVYDSVLSEAEIVKAAAPK